MSDDATVTITFNQDKAVKIKNELLDALSLTGLSQWESQLLRQLEAALAAPAADAGTGEPE